MNAIRLALALIRIPRLFAFLFLLPLLLSLVLVYVQLIFTGVVIKSVNSDSFAIEERMKDTEENNIFRLVLYGDGKALPPIRVCRWVYTEVEGRGTVEVPPVDECLPDRLDVALHVKDVEGFDVAAYAKLFDGNVERIHICETCHPDAIIDLTGEEVRSDSYSLMGLVVLNLVLMNTEVKAQYVEAAREFDKTKGLIGKRYLHAPGFRDPITLTGVNTSMAVLFNIAFLILITLWLALKAHRKVLDYFARSGALLPMVAATGKGSFYGAIWILTGARVFAFLFAAIPVTIFGLSELLEDEQIERFFGADPGAFTLWIMAIVASLGFATMVASIAELKHRHTILAFAYRYLPFGISLLGALIWGLTFVFDSSAIDLSPVRNVIASLPLMGMVPILIGPIFKPGLTVLVIHTVLTGGLLAFALRSNARWFAAHLEEL